MPQYVGPSSTHWWTDARYWTSSRVNGWRMSCFEFLAMRTNGKIFGKFWLAGGVSKPSKSQLIIRIIGYLLSAYVGSSRKSA